MGLRIASRLVVLIAAGSAACATGGGVPRPFPGAALPPGAVEPSRPNTPAPLPGTPAADVAPAAPNQIIAMAMGYRGVPYRYGGSDPSGFDCSGFVQYVFKQVGTVLPREVRDQFGVGHQVPRGDVQPGDLVFFQTVTRGASHVGLAIGDGQFVHAPNSRGVVRVERLGASYWAQRYVGARRLP